VTTSWHALTYAVLVLTTTVGVWLVLGAIGGLAAADAPSSVLRSPAHRWKCVAGDRREASSPWAAISQTTGSVARPKASGNNGMCLKEGTHMDHAVAVPPFSRNKSSTVGWTSNATRLAGHTRAGSVEARRCGHGLLLGLTAVLQGAHGSYPDKGAPGDFGGFVQANLSVPPGQTLYVWVGCIEQKNLAWGYGLGGYKGGASVTGGDGGFGGGPWHDHGAGHREPAAVPEARIACRGSGTNGPPQGERCIAQHVDGTDLTTGVMFGPVCEGTSPRL
jgi:hypothetical protein